MQQLRTSPKRWDDAAVLDCTLFKKIAKTGMPHSDRNVVIKRLYDSPRDYRVIRVWLNEAFQPVGGTVKVNYESIAIFIDFYVNLTSDRAQSIQFLNNQRQERGLPHLLDCSHLGHQPPSIKARSFFRNLRFTRNKVNVTSSGFSGRSDGLPKPQNQFAVKGSATVALESIQPTSPNTIKPASPSTTNSDLWKKTNLKILKDEMVPKVSLDQDLLNPVLGKRDAPSSSSCLPTKYRRASPILRIASDSTAFNNLIQTTHCEATNMAHTPMDVSDQIERSTTSEPSENDGIAALDEHHEHHRKVHFENDQCMEYDLHAMDPPAVKQHQNMLKSQLVHRQGLYGVETVGVSDNTADTNVVRLKGEQLESEIPLWKVQLNQEISKEMDSVLLIVSDFDRPMRSPSTLNLHSGSNNNFDLMVYRFPKPKLPRLPPIWAESRQEVCETFDWFRSYQGGVYHANNVVKGYLLSAFASRSDVFEHDGKLIISHGGGKAQSVHSQNGLLVSQKASDQLAEDKSVRALLDNYRSGRPLVLLIDDKYALFPYDLGSHGVTYAVLGFYTISYAWAEYQPAKNEMGRVVRYKFAFRWCEDQGSPWWHRAVKDSSVPVSNIMSEAKLGGTTEFPETSVRERVFENHTQNVPQKVIEIDICVSLSTLPKSLTCPHCNNLSHEVYSVWACLTPSCRMFWKNIDEKELLPEMLTYSTAFLALPPSHPIPSGLRLLPESTTTCATNGTSTGYVFTRGVHCRTCGRLSCRYQWEKLECHRCKWVKDAEITTRFAQMIWCDRLPISFEHFNTTSVSDIIPEPPYSFCHGRGRGVVQTFSLPLNRGKIHHIRASNPAGMKEADDIFVQYQEQAKTGQLKFRRWPMRAHKCRGALLTNYFSHNAGEPYQYVGGDANTVPFDQAPAVVLARNLIQKRIQQALKASAEFNEVLSCAYMERQRMAFHSDAEVGLGPLVAGLSLGSPALMHFRLHARHDPLYERRGILLTVVLRHGDVLVMDGAGVQEYYEHTVVPNNFRIAATARQINSVHNHKAEMVSPGDQGLRG